jgi:hypothetical protein
MAVLQAMANDPRTAVQQETSPHYVRQLSSLQRLRHLPLSTFRGTSRQCAAVQGRLHCSK